MATTDRIFKEKFFDAGAKRLTALMTAEAAKHRRPEDVIDLMDDWLWLSDSVDKCTLLQEFLAKKLSKAQSNLDIYEHFMREVVAKKRYLVMTDDDIKGED